jgi:hypothetical protein
MSDFVCYKINTNPIMYECVAQEEETDFLQKDGSIHTTDYCATKMCDNADIADWKIQGGHNWQQQQTVKKTETQIQNSSCTSTRSKYPTSSHDTHLCVFP